jgi:hypothetical protein
LVLPNENPIGYSNLLPILLCITFPLASYCSRNCRLFFMWVLSLLSPCCNSASADGRPFGFSYSLLFPSCDGANTLREKHPNKWIIFHLAMCDGCGLPCWTSSESAGRSEIDRSSQALIADPNRRSSYENQAFTSFLVASYTRFQAPAAYCSQPRRYYDWSFRSMVRSCGRCR